ncbi:MAG: S-layer homology domain-containing protein [Firmicutes bacterium]|nr:S-layer homology domain-containing protein [Bacillota bacterium]
MLKKGTLTLLLTFILVLGLAATASANPGKGKMKNWKFNGQGNGKAVQLMDIRSHWAEGSIRTMASLGIITGYPDFTFRPNNPVSKYEALMMISRASGYDPDPDLSWEKRLEECIDYAVDNDILTDDEADHFAGWLPAKRYEAAVWAGRAMGLEEDIDEDSFLDLDEMPAYARSYVYAMYRYNYMVGYPGRKFQPNKPLTRAELAMILYNVWKDGPADDDEEDDDSDSDDLYVIDYNPDKNSKDVSIYTSKLTLKFNDEIQADEDVEEDIKVEDITDEDDVKEVDIKEVKIDGNYLYIYLDESLDDNKDYQVTIEGGVIESEDGDETFEGIDGGEWKFSTGDDEDDEWKMSLSPDNDEEDVDANLETLKVEFNRDIKAVSGVSLIDGVKVYREDNENEVDIDKVEIEDDTLVITLEDTDLPLADGETYVVTVAPDYLEDEDTGENFDGIDDGDWTFTIED